MGVSPSQSLGADIVVIGKYPLILYNRSRGVFFFLSVSFCYNGVMEIDYNEAHWNNGPCPQYSCKKPVCECGLKYVDIPASLGDDSSDSSIAPKNGAYCNAIVKYEANGAVYIYSAEGVPVNVKEGV